MLAIDRPPRGIILTLTVTSSIRTSESATLRGLSRYRSDQRAVDVSLFGRFLCSFRPSP